MEHFWRGFAGKLTSINIVDFIYIDIANHWRYPLIIYAGYIMVKMLNKTMIDILIVFKSSLHIDQITASYSIPRLETDRISDTWVHFFI